jgi:hypothetical protein
MIDVGAFRENPRPVSFRLNMALTTDKPCLETTRKKMHSELIVFFSATSWKKLSKISSNRFVLSRMLFPFMNYGDQGVF